MGYRTFSLWMEQRESDDAVKAAVLDAVPEDIRSKIRDESELLELNTNDIKLNADEVLSRGEIKQLLTPGMESRIRQAFERGTTLRDLIDTIMGTAPAAGPQPQESLPSPSLSVSPVG